MLVLCYFFFYLKSKPSHLFWVASSLSILWIEPRIRCLLMKRTEAKAKHCWIISDWILLIFIYRCKHNLVKVLVSIKDPFCNQGACYKISWYIKISWSNKISWFIKISWSNKISWFTKIRWQWFLNIQTKYKTKTSNLTRSLQLWTPGIYVYLYWVH